MDITQVKRDLPMVKVKWCGRMYWGRVSGRLNKFATVSPYMPIDNRKLVKTIMGPCFEVAWPTIANAITRGGFVSL